MPYAHKIILYSKSLKVHKKLCIPIPGIFQRGRLYKAQSCSSIVRDKVQQPHIKTATTDRHSAIFTEKSRILRSCLGSRILGSDSDINQNNGPTQSNVLLALNATKKKPTKGCIARSSSPLYRHMGDSSLVSQCWYFDVWRYDKLMSFFYDDFFIHLIINIPNDETNLLTKNIFIVQYKHELSKYFWTVDNKSVFNK